LALGKHGLVVVVLQLKSGDLVVLEGGKSQSGAMSNRMRSV
jgi:hypothetical protein